MGDMSRIQDFLYKYSYLWQCSLKTFVFVIGWFGVVYRTVAIIYIALIISNTTPDDPRIFLPSNIILIAYGSLSLAANFLFVIGVNQEESSYLLPYSGLVFLEAISCCLGLVAGSVVLGEDRPESLYYFVPVGIAILVLYILSWSGTVKLFNQWESRREDGANSGQDNGR